MCFLILPFIKKKTTKGCFISEKNVHTVQLPYTARGINLLKDTVMLRRTLNVCEEEKHNMFQPIQVKVLTR